MDILFVGAKRGSTPPQDSRKERGRILVVDRDANVRSAVESLLGMAGCAVNTAASAAAGLRLMRVWRPSFVLLDPNIRGRAPLDVIRSFWNAGQRHTPVILLGGDELEGLKDIELMVADSLRKPFDVRELIAITARYATCTGKI